MKDRKERKTNEDIISYIKQHIVEAPPVLGVLPLSTY